ncbi:uncharacterized protein LOC107614386 [Arachis ipaensis]|uniref:uncharacterized protein LOC107614386 n=1 Tax=Arachis ipaensis TaxID=130454 RepID=UPI0007AFA808|nr:uncharacterized protein LOC107614386 [Arachis ipaensis]XP_016172082.1 uncharacterized protein LOC107614386 [Arachis ipaensis]XP_020964649.1 uncharacterized protein LOC107614386 [Arachis ipaensis]XP_025672223.1 uncharacterized protein LOC112771649 [Arachis hypogaea]XP_025672224.1 uncharacterized protein LOC112771649 [Arachis hypogaea]XP_025672225.1 uncharacterized protein LOC112771649 [Arachis hypogaea]XP_025672226.1 uncharacterized protein LOC112771649 [Arachis hypogaea]
MEFMSCEQKERVSWWVLMLCTSPLLLDHPYSIILTAAISFVFSSHPLYAFYEDKNDVAVPLCEAAEMINGDDYGIRQQIGSDSSFYGSIYYSRSTPNVAFWTNLTEFA